MENREEYQQLRDESTEYALRKMVESMNGAICVNCGSREYIEYHHIVPLALGGTNRITNYVGLCHRCHEAAHQGRHIRNYCNKKVSGRPHKVDDRAMVETFDLFLEGKIGRKQCIEMLNMSPKCKLSDMSAYKRYLKEREIVKVVNDIDMITCKRRNSRRQKTLVDGMVVGSITYIDGREEELIYRK